MAFLRWDEAGLRRWELPKYVVVIVVHFEKYIGSRGRATGCLVGPQYLAEDETRNEFLKHLGTDDTTVAKIEPVIMNYEVVSIGESAFSMIQGLQEIVIPDTVTEIGDSAFSGCVDLKTIRLGSGIQNIGVGVFDDCKCLESVYFDGDTLPVCEDSTKLQKCILRVPEKSFCSIIASPFGQQFKQITDGRYVKIGLWTFRYLQDRKKVEIVKFDGRDSEIEIPSSVILEGLGVVVAGIGKNAPNGGELRQLSLACFNVLPILFDFVGVIRIRH